MILERLTWWRVCRRVLASLEPGDRARLVQVKIQLARRPGQLDRDRGCTGSELGYFWGVRAGDGDGNALPEVNAGGVIRVFSEPTRGEAHTLEAVLRHEIEHALGADEEDCDLAGFGMFHIERAAGLMGRTTKGGA